MSEGLLFLFQYLIFQDILCILLFLIYHTLGVFKWEELGIPYTLSDVMPPDKEQIARANDILRTAEYTGYLEK